MINILLYQIVALTILGKYKNNKLEILASLWNEEFELPEGLYSVSGIQDHFEYIIKNMEKRLIIL